MGPAGALVSSPYSTRSTECPKVSPLGQGCSPILRRDLFPNTTEFTRCSSGGFYDFFFREIIKALQRAGLLAVKSGFLLFLKDYQFSLQINTLEKERS